MNPRLPRLVLPDSRPTAKLSAALPPGAALVSYVPTRERLLIFVLREGAAVRLHRVEVRRDLLTRTVEHHREALRRFHPVAELSQRLHRWLVAPLGPLPGRLFVVPGGPLHRVPFAALHGPGGAPLVERHTLSYLSAVGALRRQPSGGPGGGVGARSSFGWAGRGRRPLSFTVHESEAFAATFAGASTFQGAAATRRRFLAEAPGAKLLHVATHAEFRPEAPLSTALELSDGELSLLEVLGLKLRPGALVILSACDTGVGPISGADAVVGLHRAFRVAGAGRVVSSLWRVSDLGAALTMKHLFRALARKLSAAAALREAQNALRRRFPHPAFWAAFRLDGAP